MTPFEIEICLYHYYTGSAALYKSWHVPIGQDTYRDLVADGLLKDEGTLYGGKPMFSGTDKLKAYVQLLCDTPLPRQTFFDPRSNAVVFDSDTESPITTQ